MSANLELEYIVRKYLEDTQRDFEGEIFVLLLEYLQHLFEEEDEKILLEDLTHYEIDDFLNFYLEDKFPEDNQIQKKSIEVFKNFLKFLRKKNYITKEDEKEWKEVLT